MLLHGDTGYIMIDAIIDGAVGVDARARIQAKI